MDVITKTCVDRNSPAFKENCAHYSEIVEDPREKVAIVETGEEGGEQVIQLDESRRKVLNRIIKRKVVLIP